MSDAQLTKQVVERPTTYLFGQVDVSSMSAGTMTAAVSQTNEVFPVIFP